MSSSIERRRQLILERARQHGYVSVDALAAEFKVTPQTIRRDVNELCDRELLQRYHGGAGLTSSVENLAYRDRQVLNLPAKRAIAKLCAAAIPNHASLFINIGTTTEEVARALMDHLELKVVTNNLHVASLMSGKPDFEVIVTGGLVRARDRGIVGEAAIDLIRQFRVDIAVIGISGIDLDGSLLDFDYREVRVAQAIIEQARRVFLVTDHSKFGRSAMVKLGHVRQLDALFTDRPPPDSIAAALAEAKVALHVAAPEASTDP